MEDIITVENLKESWQEIASDVKKNKKIKFEEFNAAFSQTYSLLSKYKGESNIDKKYVELIAEVYLFANINDSTLDETCLAAFVLSERMLKYCVFDNMSANPTVYFADMRKEIVLNFEDIGDSFLELTRIFKDRYWQKLSL